MSLPAIFRPAAYDDLISAREWYDRQRSGLGDEFLDEVARVVDRISIYPQLHAEVIGRIRRVKLNRFPYVLYYRERLEHLEILAVFHGSRNDSAWRKRIGE